MAVTHAKVSTVPDEADTDLVRPSDWNAAHVGAVEVAQATVDFGTTEGASLTTAAVAAPWVGATSKITVSLGGSSADHDPEDGLIEGITACVSALDPGVGFTVMAFAPAGTWGRYTLNCAGI
jgi:hypothetical protein